MSLKQIIKNVLPYGLVNNRQEVRNCSSDVASIEPTIYNSLGDRMRVFYLKDSVCTHSPYTFSSQNYGMTQSILWDRYNRALPIHFYTHRDIFDEHYTCKKKFAFLLESEAIVPEEYESIIRHPEYMKDYAAIFTHSERLLNQYQNACFIPGSSVWYGGTVGGGEMDANVYKKKIKNVSLVSSNKAQCDLHRFRLQLANWFDNSDSVDVLGTFNNGKYVSIADSLKDYRYSIVIENYISDCYFTEKILNCFASMTVPIYIGAKKICRFFNIDGIIQIAPNMGEEEIKRVISQCCETDYELRKVALQDNYARVKEYLCIEDYVYKHYGNMFDL